MDRISHLYEMHKKFFRNKVPQRWKGWGIYSIAYLFATKNHVSGTRFLLSSSKPAAKSLQSCPTLCDPIDGSPPGSLVPEILQARTLEWVAISFSMTRSLVFPILFFSSISLHWSLKKAFLSLLAIFWNSAFRCLHLSFSTLLFASLHSYL